MTRSPDMASLLHPRTITADLLLRAYACGVFPMADDADDEELFWVEPEWRGVLPLESFHVPRSLARTMRRGGFDIRYDADFDAVLDGCAGGGPERPKTWINAPIRRLYRDLFDAGHCHTVETWSEGELVGGLYGVTLGRAFFGESMFSRATDASKVALVALVERLRERGFVLLDTQFVTEHLARFGVVAVHRADYDAMLAEALEGTASF